MESTSSSRGMWPGRLLNSTSSAPGARSMHVGSYCQTWKRLCSSPTHAQGCACAALEGFVALFVPVCLLSPVRCDLRGLPAGGQPFEACNCLAPLAFWILLANLRMEIARLCHMQSFGRLVEPCVHRWTILSPGHSWKTPVLGLEFMSRRRMEDTPDPSRKLSLSSVCETLEGAEHKHLRLRTDAPCQALNTKPALEQLNWRSSCWKPLSQLGKSCSLT